MKKIAVTAALAAIATVSVSANATTYGTTAGSNGTNGVMAIASTTATNAIGSGLKEDVKVQLSNNVLGAVVFNDASNTYGVAAGNPRGKGVAYQGSTAGGAPTKVSGVSTAADVTTANVTAGANAAASGS